jgi:hypothetical protein
LNNERRKAAKQHVAERLKAMLLRRPGDSLPADKVVRRIVELYGNQHPTPDELVPRRNILEDILRADIPDLTVRRGFKKSHSKDGERTSAVLMIYEPRVVKQGERTFLGAFHYTIILKPSEAWVVLSVEPAVTQSHLFQRIIERSGQAVDSFAEVQERLSDVWIALMWMRSHRILSGRGFIPHEFMTPWEDGLLFGNVEKLMGLPDAKPLVYIVRSGPAQRRYLPDLYLEGDNRLNAFTHTFVGPVELRSHQIVLRDRLTRFISSNGKVIEYLRSTWKIAAHADNPFTEEIMGVFRFRRPTEEWRLESAFSASSQKRYQTDAVSRSTASLTSPKSKQ